MTSDRPTLPPTTLELPATAKGVSESILDLLVSRLPDPHAAVDVLCFCTAHLTASANIAPDLVVYRFGQYLEQRQQTGAPT